MPFGWFRKNKTNATNAAAPPKAAAITEREEMEARGMIAIQVEGPGTWDGQEMRPSYKTIYVTPEEAADREKTKQREAAERVAQKATNNAAAAAAKEARLQETITKEVTYCNRILNKYAPQRQQPDPNPSLGGRRRSKTKRSKKSARKSKRKTRR
jgi:hypothetical protein